MCVGGGSCLIGRRQASKARLFSGNALEADSAADLSRNGGLLLLVLVLQQECSNNMSNKAR